MKHVILARTLLIPISPILGSGDFTVPKGEVLPILHVLDDRLISEFEGRKIALFEGDYSLDLKGWNHVTNWPARNSNPHH